MCVYVRVVMTRVCGQRDHVFRIVTHGADLHGQPQRAQTQDQNPGPRAQQDSELLIVIHGMATWLHG